MKKRVRLPYDRQNEVLDQVTVEPVLLTTEAQPSYVLLAADRDQQLVDRLVLLEDCAFGQLAQTALERSQMVGTEAFTAALQQIAQSPQ
ncbi:MAG: prevent-host-death protein [Lyngbya sp. HA4199-MV5]|jgi:hypothetical protein|nr:prevent-host-death protein [Lyngbya sp. HA4199-MV5]